MYDQLDKHIYFADAEGIYYSSGYIWDIQTGTIYPTPVGILAQPFSPANAKGNDLEYFKANTLIMSKPELEAKLQAQKKPAPMVKTEPSAPAQEPIITTTSQPQTQNTKMAEIQIPQGYSIVDDTLRNIELTITVAAGSGKKYFYIGDSKILPKSIGNPATEVEGSGVSISGTHGADTLQMINEFFRTKNVLISSYNETTQQEERVFGSGRLKKAQFILGSENADVVPIIYGSLVNQNTLNMKARGFGESLRVVLSDTQALIKMLNGGVAGGVGENAPVEETITLSFLVVAVQKNPILSTRVN